MIEKENFDWVDNYGFILVAFAHMTNWHLSDAEIQTISSKLQLMLSKSNNDYNEEQVERATSDFIARNSTKFKIIKEFKTANRFIHPTYANGIILFEKHS